MEEDGARYREEEGRRAAVEFIKRSDVEFVNSHEGRRAVDLVRRREAEER